MGGTFTARRAGKYAEITVVTTPITAAIISAAGEIISLGASPPPIKEHISRAECTAQQMQRNPKSRTTRDNAKRNRNNTQKKRFIKHRAAYLLFGRTYRLEYSELLWYFGK